MPIRLFKWRIFRYLCLVANVGPVLVIGGGSTLILGNGNGHLRRQLRHSLGWHARPGCHDGHHGLTCHRPDHWLVHASSTRSRSPELVLHVHHAAAGTAALLRPARLSHSGSHVGLALVEEALGLRDGGHEVATLLRESHLKGKSLIRCLQ